MAQKRSVTSIGAGHYGSSLPSSGAARDGRNAIFEVGVSRPYNGDIGIN